MSKDFLPRYFTPLFQRQLLALLLQNPEAFGRFAGIWSHSYFNEHHHRSIAAAYLKIRQAGGEHPSPASLSQELFGELDPRAPLSLDQQALKAEAAALYEIPTANLDYSLKEIRAWAQNQALINAINECVDYLQIGKTTEIRPTIDRALGVGADLLNSGITLNANTRNPSSVLVATEMSGLPTGISSLDTYFKGGLRAGEMLTVVGGPGAFKSGAMLNFTIPALQQPLAKKVTYITLEMPETQVYRRYCHRISMENYRCLMEKREVFDTKFNEAIVNYHGALHIKGFGSTALDLGGLKTYLDFLDSKGHQTELLVVDYPQIMARTGLGPQEKEYVGIGMLYAGIRSLAVERGIPVIVAAQSTREALRNPELLALHHISATMDVARHSDFVVAIIQTEEEKKAGYLRLKLLKARNDASGVIITGVVDYELYHLKDGGEWKPQPTAEDSSDESYSDPDKATQRRQKAAKGNNSHPVPVGAVYRAGGNRGTLLKRQFDRFKKRQSGLDSDPGRTR